MQSVAPRCRIVWGCPSAETDTCGQHVSKQQGASAWTAASRCRWAWRGSRWLLVVDLCAPFVSDTPDLFLDGNHHHHHHRHHYIIIIVIVIIIIAIIIAIVIIIIVIIVITIHMKCICLFVPLEFAPGSFFRSLHQSRRT